METQTYNNKNGIIAPPGNICMCCGKEILHNEYANYHIPIYKEEDRTNLLVYKSVKFRKIGILVTRCAKCEKIQKKAELISMYYSFGIGLSIVSIGLLLIFFMENMRNLGIVLIVLGIITGALLWSSKGEDKATDFLEKKQVLSKENAAAQYEEVRELLRSGWSFQEPEVSKI